MAANSGLKCIDDSNEFQKVDHFVTSPLNFFKDNLGNLTFVVSKVGIWVDNGVVEVDGGSVEVDGVGVWVDRCGLEKEVTLILRLWVLVL